MPTLKQLQCRHTELLDSLGLFTETFSPTPSLQLLIAFITERSPVIYHTSIVLTIGSIFSFGYSLSCSLPLYFVCFLSKTLSSPSRSPASAYTH